ncbi:manganese efflux pump MntP [Bosea sp. NPDC055332]
MSPASIAVLAVGMSIDAFVASVGRGARLRQARLAEALRTGLIFGAIETLTPVIGWTLGLAASRYVAAVDHWIAFLLLAFVGGRMVVHAIRASDTETDAEAGPERGLATLLATAIGTSIDAMAVGVSLAFLDVNIAIVAAAIGLATFLMSTGGMLMGRFVGARFGAYAEIAGGLALIGLGLSILHAHITGS